METQQKFLFIDGRPDTPSPATASAPVAASTEDAIIGEIRAVWRIPFLRQKVSVTLRDCPVDEMNGLFEIGDPAPNIRST